MVVILCGVVVVEVIDVDELKGSLVIWVAFVFFFSCNAKLSTANKSERRKHIPFFSMIVLLSFFTGISTIISYVPKHHLGLSPCVLLHDLLPRFEQRGLYCFDIGWYSGSV